MGRTGTHLEAAGEQHMTLRLALTTAALSAAAGCWLVALVLL
jgi:hypothetical protein